REELRPPHHPTLGYLHLSRLSTALPAVHRLGIRELRLALLRPVNEGIAGVLKAFDLYDDEVLGLLRRRGLTRPEAPIGDPWNDVSLHAWLEDPALHRLVTERAERARALLHRYLVEQGVFSVRRAA